MVYKKEQGLSMLEIMIALAIIAVMGVLVGPSLMKFLGQGRETATKTRLAGLKQAVTDYIRDIGHPPNRKEGGLEALIESPKGSKIEKKWDGPYLEGVDELPEDAWGNEFTYQTGKEIMHKKKYRYYEIISPGENGDIEDGKIFHTGA